jgi:hypothetical protein
MKPPWKMYPEIPAHSAGWRMGGGEEYYDEFYRWFSKLTPNVQTEFQLSNPEPQPWKGTYKIMKDHPWLESGSDSANATPVK